MFLCEQRQGGRFGRVCREVCMWGLGVCGKCRKFKDFMIDALFPMWSSADWPGGSFRGRVKDLRRVGEISDSD